jgi:phosphate:Na+ symporter
MIELVHESYKLALLTYKTRDTDIGMKVFEKEKLINAMEKSLRKNHMQRLNEGSCVTQSGIIFLDAISNLERMGDHSVNIAESIIEVVNKQKIVTDIAEDN